VCVRAYTQNSTRTVVHTGSVDVGVVICAFLIVIFVIFDIIDGSLPIGL
jgi:hypothetical protein